MKTARVMLKIRLGRETIKHVEIDVDVDKVTDRDKLLEVVKPMTIVLAREFEEHENAKAAQAS